MKSPAKLKRRVKVYDRERKAEATRLFKESRCFPGNRRHRLLEEQSMAKKLSQWELNRIEEDKGAVEKGWLPKKAWKGKLNKKVVGRLVLAGWLDVPPRVGIIVEPRPGDSREIDVFFPDDGIIEHVERSQIFGIGEKVSIRVTESNKLAIGLETGIVCDMK